MINWFSVVANGFWLAGLALMLAALSYYYWKAGQLGLSLGQVLNAPPFQRLALTSLLLVGVGLALTADGLWQIVPATALILVCVVALVLLFRERADGTSAK